MVDCLIEISKIADARKFSVDRIIRISFYALSGFTSERLVAINIGTWFTQYEYIIAT